MIEFAIDKLEVGDDVLVEKEHLIQRLTAHNITRPNRNVESCIGELGMYRYLAKVRCIVIRLIKPYTLLVQIQDKNLINNSIFITVDIQYTS